MIFSNAYLKTDFDTLSTSQLSIYDLTDMYTHTRMHIYIDLYKHVCDIPRPHAVAADNITHSQIALSDSRIIFGVTHYV